jgi:hypothetical protein
MKREKKRGREEGRKGGREEEREREKEKERERESENENEDMLWFAKISKGALALLSICIVADSYFIRVP